MNRRTNSFLSALVLLISACVPLHTAARAEETGGRIIVSLGDSYSSGEGLPPYFDWDEPDDVKENSPDWVAHRSLNSWPSMLELPAVGKMADHWLTNWFFAAASGATTADLAGKQHKEINRATKHSVDLAPQLDVFGDIGDGQKADYVTVTIGGNDAGFAEIVKTAALHCSYLNPNSLYDRIFSVWVEFDRPDGIRDNLQQAYRNIADRAGDQAAILVAGYPGLLSMKGSALLFDANETQFIDSQVSKFNNEIRSLVSDCYIEGLNIYFVSVEEAFYGHEAYTEDPYIHGVIIDPSIFSLSEETDQSNPVSAASLHPNVKGAQAYAACVQEAIDYLEEGKRTGLERPKYSADDDSYQRQVIENAERLLKEEFPEMYKDLTGYIRYLNDKLSNNYEKNFFDAEMYQRKYNFAVEWSARWIGLLADILIGDLKGEFAGEDLTVPDVLEITGKTVNRTYMAAVFSEVSNELSQTDPNDLIPAVSVNAVHSIRVSFNELYEINDRMTDGRFANFDDAAAFIRIHQMNKACMAAAEMGVKYYQDATQRNEWDHFLAIAWEFVSKHLGGIASKALVSELVPRLTASYAYRLGAGAFHELFDVISGKSDNPHVREWTEKLYEIEEETKQLYQRPYRSEVSPWETDDLPAENEPEEETVYEPSLSGVRWQKKTISYTDYEGYTIQITIQFSPWILQSNTELLDNGWKELGMTAELPTMKNGWFFTRYTDDWHTWGSPYKFSARMNDMYYIIGTISLRNITQGWDITADHSHGTSVNMQVKTDVRDPYPAGNTGAGCSLTMTKIMYSDDPTIQPYYSSLIPHMVSNRWGPVGFVIAIPEYKSPKYPNGTAETMLETAKLYVADEVFTIGVQND